MMRGLNFFKSGFQLLISVLAKCVEMIYNNVVKNLIKEYADEIQSGSSGQGI